MGGVAGRNVECRKGMDTDYNTMCKQSEHEQDTKKKLWLPP